MEINITGNDLLAIGYQQGKVLGMALETIKHFDQSSKEEILALLKKVKDYPESFLNDEVLQVMASAMVEEVRTPAD